MIDAGEQLRMVEAHIDDALDDLARLLVTHRAEIRRRTLTRVQGLGLAEYGDRTWHLSRERLQSEAIDELADGGFYLVPRRAHLAGESALQ